ncbi:unnamed protein product [Cyprideis torosa]|uniref:Uncharacterized protein n=1 Tax=Cyprideis torosa TaxID=163714 RepID=A0A7R8WI89_9CRUS|nr:unnamed protein product [Cyprideis torosa]CAG0900432.1 unnamed protein product [Cyprideis torosa]
METKMLNEKLQGDPFDRESCINMLGKPSVRFWNLSPERAAKFAIVGVANKVHSEGSPLLVFYEKYGVDKSAFLLRYVFQQMGLFNIERRKLNHRILPPSVTISETYFMNKVIWITGASSGLGRAIAVEVASLCRCKLVLSGLEGDWLEEVKKECLDVSRGALTADDILLIPGDLTDSAKHQEWFQQILKTFGKLDVLFSNAGIGVSASVHSDVYGSTERKAFEVNYFAMTSLTRCVLPYMRERKSGHIVFTASVFGHVISCAVSTYAATKHAILAFANTLRCENHLFGVRVTTLEPSGVDTRILNEKLQGDPTERELSIKLLSSPLVKFWMLSPERAAKLALVAVANGSYGGTS